MPGLRAAQNLQMPHPLDWKGRKMPRGSPAKGGGGRELGAAGIDWCMTPDLPWNFYFAYDKILLIFEVVLYEILLSLVFLLHMWNYVDVITLSCHAIIFVLRVASIIKGGDPYHNRLLEAINYLYGVNTLLLVLRFSSILELYKTVGPLQLALFRMIVDLMIILVQFVFVILAFSVAITMIYTAEMSYLTPAQETNRTQVKRWGLRMSIFSFFSVAAFS